MYVYIIDDTEYTAEIGAEIFNDYESNIAIGLHSHVEGINNTGIGTYCHVERQRCITRGHYAHAEGYHIIASGYRQHVQGECNIEDADSRYAHIVGNGKDYNNRSNAHTLDWGGNAWFAGDVYVGGSGQDDAENVKKLATKEYVDTVSKDFIVNFELVYNDDYTEIVLSSASATFDEVYNAIQNGKNVVGHATIVDGIHIFIFKLTEIMSTSAIRFECCVSSGLITEQWMIEMSSHFGNHFAIQTIATLSKVDSTSATALILVSPNGTRFSITVGDDGILTTSEITE